MFRREGNDLYYEQDIQLIEALTGFKIVLTHLDGRKVLIQNTPGDVVSPGEKLRVPDQGFSIKNRPDSYGDLYITFNVRFDWSELSQEQVIFPKTVTAEQSKQLKRIFSYDEILPDAGLAPVLAYRVPNPICGPILT